MNTLQNTNGSDTVSAEALIAAGLISQAMVLPAAENVRRGKGFVSVQRFAGSGSASAIKASLKLANPKLSAKALKAKVLETLRGERDIREQLSIAWVQGCFQDGLVPSHGERTKNGGALKLVSAPEPKIAAAVIPLTREQLLAQIAEMQAKVDAMNASQQ